MSVQLRLTHVVQTKLVEILLEVIYVNANQDILGTEQIAKVS